jgi:hypothetical protein
VNTSHEYWVRIQPFLHILSPLWVTGAITDARLDGIHQE